MKTNQYIYLPLVGDLKYKFGFVDVLGKINSHDRTEVDLSPTHTHVNEEAFHANSSPTAPGQSK